MTPKHLIILGTHGIPASHGGFETCAEKLALFMRDQNWQVTVYGQGLENSIQDWHGIRCMIIKRITHRLLHYINPLLYDLQAIWHARKLDGVFLTMGYNTAVFNLILSFYGHKQIINMDGMEWKRTKYKRWHEKTWLRFNEWIALKIAQTCIADHTAIADYLRSRNTQTNIVTIAYGADPIQPEEISKQALTNYGLQTGHYGLIIARPEAENQILELVTAWTKSSITWPLIILGHYKSDNLYHHQVMQAAGLSVRFIGAIYDTKIVNALRVHAGVYLHGHTVGGTNPSLVEAMAAGCVIIAHDNVFNRGVADETALYFQDQRSLITQIQSISDHKDLKEKARTQQSRYYTWDTILQDYQIALEHLQQKPVR